MRIPQSHASTTVTRALPHAMNERDVLREFVADQPLPIELSKRPYHEAIAALRAADLCAACGKTRLVVNVSLTRGLHSPFRCERVSPQTHCACPEGPVTDPDSWELVFSRTVGTKAPRIYLVDLMGTMEPLKLREPRHGALDFDWGPAQNAGAATLALHLLLLVTGREAAEDLYHRYKAQVLATLPTAGARLTLGEVRAWVRGAGQMLMLDDLVTSYLDSNEYASADEAEAAIQKDLETEFRRALSSSDRVRLGIAVQSEWTRRQVSKS